nr:PREDICTED: protein scarlet-like isoform X1 [Bemisia tabaci]
MTTLHLQEDVGISWKDLSVWSNRKVADGLFKQQKVQRTRLLNSVSGYARAGSLTVIMGASGAGKTTLLSTVSGRSSANERRGEILLNGRPVEPELMLRISGFMPQTDLTVENLTVLEHLQFMGCLRMDVRVSENQRNRIINNLILDFGLRKCMHSQLRFLSGGERRKVSLAVQLLTDPPVLFCDEPTTGLDSFNALSMVSCLSSLAKNGKTVVCTIHQPTSGVFETFDEVILMVAGGRVAFQGAINDALDHFKTLGMVCPKAYNTAEFLISQLSIREDTRTKKEVYQICDLFDTSESYKIFQKKFNEVNTVYNDTQIVHEIDKQFLRFNTWQGADTSTQFRLLAWRHGLNIARNVNRIFISVCTFLFTGFVIAASYRGVIFDQNGVQNLQGFFNNVITETIFCQSYRSLYTFQAEIPVLLRETKDKVYSVGPFYLSRIIYVVLLCSVETFIFSFTIFWITGFSGGTLSFPQFVAPIAVSGLAATAYGCAMSSNFETVSSASLLMVPLDFISYTFSGMFLQLSSVPFYLRWLKYVSRFYYGVEAFSILQWTSVDEIPCPQNPDIMCLLTADKVLEKYGYRTGDIELDFLGLILMFIVLNTIGYLGIRNRSKQQASY